MPRTVSAAVLLALAPALAAAQPAGDWTMVFQDEFNGTALDTNIWTPMIGDGSQYGIPGWGNNELQYYTGRPENVEVSGGTLKVIARRESYLGFQYTSARLRTLGDLDIEYGYIEARMKLPAGQGYWPAFWMLPSQTPYGGWAASGEIDIMESVNSMTSLHGTLHFGGEWPQNTSNGRTRNGVTLDDGFHTYGIDWQPDSITWYYDGQFYGQINSSGWFSLSPDASGNPRAPFDRPFHLLINCAIGGNWPGSPNGSTQFPQTFETDWVRVYERQQAPVNEGGEQIPGRIEAEDFDTGGQGVSYLDNTGGNQGGQLRPLEDVDIEATNGGGFNVGFIEVGEWLEYTVTVAEAGPYDMTARIASNESDAVFQLYNGLTPLIPGGVSVPNTGGWQNWQTISERIDLPAGTTVLRFESMVEEQFNIDWMDFAAIGPCNAADLAAPVGLLDEQDLFAAMTRIFLGFPDADFDLDGSITFFDLLFVINQYDEGCAS